MMDVVFVCLYRRVERQTLLVSATMPQAVLRAAAVWGHRPLLVRAQSIIRVEDFRVEPSSIDSETKESTVSPDLQGAKESLPPNLEHFYVVASLRHHVDILRKSIHALEARSVIVFLNHSRRLKDVQFKLEARGLTAGTCSYSTSLYPAHFTRFHGVLVLHKFSGYKYLIHLVMHLDGHP